VSAGNHDGGGFRVALRHQVQVHLARDVTRGDLDDDALGAGSANVRDGDLERPAAAGRSACVVDGHAEIGRAAGAREPAHDQSSHHGHRGAKRDHQQRPLERRPLPPDAAAAGGSLRGHVSNRPSAAPIEAGNAKVTTGAVAAPFTASTRPSIASIAVEKMKATA